MKIQICTGSKCTFYGADNILDRMYDFKENFHDYPNIKEDAVVDIELLPCQDICKGNHEIAPIVYIDGELITNAKSQEVMAKVMDKLREE